MKIQSENIVRRVDLGVPMQILYRIIGAILFCVFIPKILFDLLLGRKTRRWVQERLFPNPISTSVCDVRPLVWVHAVSVGEVMAVEPVLQELLKVRPCKIIMSTVTMTGMETAKKRCSGLVDQFCFLPFDFRFSIKRLFKNVRPDLIVFSEGDVWPEFLFQAKKSDARVAIVNAKVSDRSFRRMRCFPRIGKWLFSKVDTICVQNELYAKRFQKLVSPNTTLLVSGNTKGDTKKSPLEDVKALKTKLFPNKLKNWNLPKSTPEIQDQRSSPGCTQGDGDGLDGRDVGDGKTNSSTCLGIHLESEIIITLGSSHAPEEQKILEAIHPFLIEHDNVKVIIVPRHPHRFSSVFDLASKLHIGPVARLSSLTDTSPWKVLVVDKMGLLEPMYGLSTLAIICGSFIENIGGHNALEALQWGVPCIVGPHMRSQKTVMEIAEVVGGVVQVKNFQDILPALTHLLLEPEHMRRVSLEALLVASYSQGAAQRCADSLNQLLS